MHAVLSVAARRPGDGGGRHPQHLVRAPVLPSRLVAAPWRDHGSGSGHGGGRGLRAVSGGEGGGYGRRGDADRPGGVAERMTDAAVRELAARVIDRIGDPVDRWAVAVALESGDSTPADARAKPASASSVFALADVVFAECLARRRSRPEITVAMPAHDRAALIGAAIRSVLAQDDVELELIGVDGGSTDDTAAVVASFADPRIVVLRNQVRRGVAHCHNQVVAKSRAPFIAHVDSDDMVMPGALRKMVDRLSASTDHGQAHCIIAPISA